MQNILPAMNLEGLRERVYLIDQQMCNNVLLSSLNIAKLPTLPKQ